MPAPGSMPDRMPASSERTTQPRVPHGACLNPPLYSQIMTFRNVLVIRRPTFATNLSVGLLAGESRADLARDVVEQGDAHHEDQQGDPDLLAEHLRALGEWAALQPLHELEHHLATVEYRNGQEVEEPEAQGNEHQEIHERHGAVA